MADESRGSGTDRAGSGARAGRRGDPRRRRTAGGYAEGIWITAYALLAMFLNMTFFKDSLIARAGLNLLIPLALLRSYGRRPLREYGMDFNRVRLQITWAFLAVLLLLPMILLVSMREDFQAFYSHPSGDGATFLHKELVAYGFTYLFWEFLLRGFLLFGLAYHFGWWAILLEEIIIFPLAHLGKPPLEIVLAAYAGIVFSLAALKSRSFLPAFVSHWAAAVILDTIVFVNEWGWEPLLQPFGV